jgi:diketogulonate reductase-like aldo/keto reductase
MDSRRRDEFPGRRRTGQACAGLYRCIIFIMRSTILEKHVMSTHPNRTRRRLLASLAAAPLLGPALAQAQPARPATRAIPSSGEAIPLVGLGSWITFNVGNDRAARDASAEVMRAFFQAGGRLIDSSPMYGSAQEVIGYGLDKIGRPANLFAADKVWISDGDQGRAQMETSRRLWGIPRFDLMQVHNLVAWEAHLPTLFAMKAAGQLRYVGITTSHGRRHGDLERIMASQPIDFVQLTYNVFDREVEQRLLPLALDRGIAVLVNRPFQQGALLDRLARRPLPAWAIDIDCTSWAQFALKFVISHPGVTCAIPATTRVDHIRENVGTASGRLPDQAMRARMAAHVARL